MSVNKTKIERNYSGKNSIDALLLPHFTRIARETSNPPKKHLKLESGRRVCSLGRFLASPLCTYPSVESEIRMKCINFSVIRPKPASKPMVCFTFRFFNA